MWKYSLPGYELQLLGELQRQQHARLYCDTLLQADGVLIPAHSCLLAALSPFLAQRLATSPWPRAGQSRQLQLRTINAAALRKLVGLLYSGKMEGEGASEKEEVLAAAVRLGIGPLEEGSGDGGMDGAREESERRSRKEAAVQTKGWGEREGRRDVGTDTEGGKDGETAERRLADAATQTAPDVVPPSPRPSSLPGTEPRSSLTSDLRTAPSQNPQGPPPSPGGCQRPGTPNSEPEDRSVRKIPEATSPIVLRSHVKKGPVLPSDHRPLLLGDPPAPPSSLARAAVVNPPAVTVGDGTERREEGARPSSEGTNTGGEECGAKRREGGGAAMKNMVRLRQLENMETQTTSFKVKLRRKNRRSLWELVPMQETEETLSSQNKHSLLPTLNRPPLPPLTLAPPGQAAGPLTLTPPAEPVTSPNPPCLVQLPPSVPHHSPPVPQCPSFGLQASSSSVALTPDSDCQLHFPQPLPCSLSAPLPDPPPPPPPGEDSDEHLDRLLEDIMMDLNILPPMALERDCNGTHSDHLHHHQQQQQQQQQHQQQQQQQQQHQHQQQQQQQQHQQQQEQRHLEGVCQDCDHTVGVAPCSCCHGYGTGSDDAWSTETASYPSAFSVPCTFPHDLHQDPPPAPFYCSHPPSAPHHHHPHPTCVNPNRADGDRGAPRHPGSDPCPSDPQNQSRHSRSCSAGSGRFVSHAPRPTPQQPHHCPSHCQATARGSGEGQANRGPGTSTAAFGHAERTKPHGEADPRQAATDQKCWCTMRPEPARACPASGLRSEASSEQKLHYPAGQGANPGEEPRPTSQSAALQSWEDLRLPLCLSPLNADHTAATRPPLSRHPSTGFPVQHPHPRRPSWLSLTPGKLPLTPSSAAQSSERDARPASHSERSLARELDPGDPTVRESARSGWKERRIKDESPTIGGEEEEGGDGSSRKRRRSRERRRRGDDGNRREFSAAKKNKKKKKSKKRKRSPSGGRREFRGGGGGGGRLTVKVSEATQRAVGLGLGLCSVSLSSNNILAKHRGQRHGPGRLLLPGLTAACPGAPPRPQRGRGGQEGSHAQCPFPQGRITTKSCPSETDAPWKGRDPGPSETPLVHVDPGRVVKTEEEEPVPPKRKRGRPRKKTPVEETPVVSVPPPPPSPAPVPAGEHGGHDGKGRLSEQEGRASTGKGERPKRRCRKTLKAERREEEEDEEYGEEEKPPPRRKRRRKRAGEDPGEVLSKHNYCRSTAKRRDEEETGAGAEEDSDPTPPPPEEPSRAPNPPGVTPEPFAAPGPRTGTGPERRSGHPRSVPGASSSSSTSVLPATAGVPGAIQPPASPVMTVAHHRQTSISSKEDKLTPSKRSPMVTLKAFGQLLRHRHLQTRKSDQHRRKSLQAEAGVEAGRQGGRDAGGLRLESGEPSPTGTVVGTDSSPLAAKEMDPSGNHAGSFEDPREQRQRQRHVTHRGPEEDHDEGPDGTRRTNDVEREKNDGREREPSKERDDDGKTDADDALGMQKETMAVSPAACTKASGENKMDAPRHPDRRSVGGEEQGSSEVEVVDWSSDVDVGDREDTAFQRPCFADAQRVTGGGEGEPEEEEEEEEVDVEEEEVDVEEEEGGSLNRCLVDNTKTGLTEAGGLTNLPRGSGTSTVENVHQDPIHSLNKGKMAAAPVLNPHIPQNVDHLLYQSPCKVTVGSTESCDEEGEVDILGCSPIKCLLLDDRRAGVGIRGTESVMEEDVNEIDVTGDELDSE